MAFWPPVSAMKGTIGPGRAANARWIECAVSTEPVKATPAMRGSPTRLAPIVSPAPGANCKTSLGTPAWCNSATARAAINGVCSAGLAMTALPAANAALTWPRKIASGKFQGLMQANTPRPCKDSSLRSPVGPGKRSGSPNSWRARSA